MTRVCMPWILAACAGLALGGACGHEGSAAAPEAAIPAVSGPAARRLVDEQGATLLDVRSAEEFAVDHADGAVNIPLGELDRRLDEITKAKPVVVYCQSGNRSARAARVLHDNGYVVHDLGSLSAW